MEWEAFEHIHNEKGSDWFWAVGVVIVGIAVTAIILGNLLFAMLILISGSALLVSAVKKPRLIRFAITDRGILIGNKMYPYTTLESFWVEDEIMPPKLILKSQKVFMPYLLLPLSDEVDTDLARDLLLEVLEEIEHHQTALEHFMDYLGF
jgi:hypothetical protein